MKTTDDQEKLCVAEARIRELEKMVADLSISNAFGDAVNKAPDMQPHDRFKILSVRRSKR